MSDDELLPQGMFEEPAEFQAVKPKGSEIDYKMQDGTTIKLNLLGSSPLYGHILTNACKYVSEYLQNHADTLVKGKTVLEFGAGGALPSLVCAKLGASHVVATDYPDADLIQNIRHNIAENGVARNCTGVGFIWGNDVAEIVESAETFDTIILSDVIFNHTEHYKLLRSCMELLTPKTGKILVTFSPHRPKLFNEDLSFFNKAQEPPYGFASELVEMKHYSPLFKDDKDESTAELRSRVYFYMLHPRVDDC